MAVEIGAGLTSGSGLLVHLVGPVGLGPACCTWVVWRVADILVGAGVEERYLTALSFRNEGFADMRASLGADLRLAAAWCVALTFLEEVGDG